VGILAAVAEEGVLYGRPVLLGTANLREGRPSLIPDQAAWQALLSSCAAAGLPIVGYQLPKLEDEYLSRMDDVSVGLWRSIEWRADLHESASLLARQGQLSSKSLGLAELAHAAGRPLPRNGDDWDVWLGVAAAWAMLAARLRELSAPSPQERRPGPDFSSPVPTAQIPPFAQTMARSNEPSDAPDVDLMTVLGLN